MLTRLWWTHLSAAAAAASRYVLSSPLCLLMLIRLHTAGSSKFVSIANLALSDRISGAIQSGEYSSCSWAAAYSAGQLSHFANNSRNPFPRRATFGRVPVQDLGARTRLAGTTGRGLDPEDGPERSGQCLRLFVVFRIEMQKVNEADLTHFVPPKHGVDGLGKLGAAGLVDAASVHQTYGIPLHEWHTCWILVAGTRA
ncbi:hypothetical protein MCOR13_004878 [Pyricularia oryzae]|nr:hypothetical protein MCOR13_004878 [Pyricularia oryzae]